MAMVRAPKNAEQGFNFRAGFVEVDVRSGKKDIFLIVRVTPEEKKEFSKLAKEKGASVQQLTRDLWRGYVEGEKILQ